MIFQVSGLPKTMKNRCKNAFEKNIEKNGSKIDLGVHFGFPKPPKIDPTSKKIKKNGIQKKAPKKRPRAAPDLKTNQAF